MDYLASGLEVIKIEKRGLDYLEKHLSDDSSFNDACEIIHNASGKLIVIGMGKSGHIGSKISATLASTGTKSYFVHPAEAGHGDLGVISKNDVVLAISNSGSSSEIMQLVPNLKQQKIKIISLTNNSNSMLAQQSDVHINLYYYKEACPHNLAPTTSTTNTLVIGDAIAIALLKANKFTKEDFAFSHPSGALGKRLLFKVQDIMKKNNDCPVVKSCTSIENTILEITSKRLGMSLISDDNKILLGIFTDGDLRRIFQKKLYKENQNIKEIMTINPTVVKMNDMAVDALIKMEELKITAIPVLDENNYIAGVIHLHDLVQMGISN